MGLHQIGLGWFGAWLVGANLATWPLYAWDKRRAGLGERRVPELVLLDLALVGGRTAAIVAMAVLRHKKQEPAFLVPFAGFVLVQAIMVGMADRNRG